MERKAHFYSTYGESDLIGSWHAQVDNLKYWEAQGERCQVSAEDCRTAMRQIERELEKRFTLPAYMKPRPGAQATRVAESKAVKAGKPE